MDDLAASYVDAFMKCNDSQLQEIFNSEISREWGINLSPTSSPEHSPAFSSEPSLTRSSMSTYKFNENVGIMVSPVTALPVDIFSIVSMKVNPSELCDMYRPDKLSNMLKNPAKKSSYYTNHWLEYLKTEADPYLFADSTTPGKCDEYGFRIVPLHSSNPVLDAHDSLVKSTTHLDSLKEAIEEDHCYSVPLPPDDLFLPAQVKREITDEDSMPDKPPPSAGSSGKLPDIETMPLYASDDNMPVSQPQSVPKSRGKNMTLLQAEKEKSVTTRKRKGRKPKNSPPAKKAKVGRPRTRNPRVCLNAADLEDALQRQSCRKNPRGRKKVTNRVETSPETSAPASIYNGDSDNDCLDSRLNDEKRASHNEAERQRRQQMSTLFLNLKLQCPALTAEKTSQLDALKVATGLVLKYQEVEKQLHIERANVLRRLKHLRALTGTRS